MDTARTIRKGLGSTYMPEDLVQAHVVTDRPYGSIPGSP